MQNATLKVHECVQENKIKDVQGGCIRTYILMMLCQRSQLLLVMVKVVKTIIFSSFDFLNVTKIKA